jgi:hypothetical protein
MPARSSDFGDPTDRCPFVLRKLIKVNDLQASMPPFMKKAFLSESDELNQNGLRENPPFEETYFSENKHLARYIESSARSLDEEARESAFLAGEDYYGNVKAFEQLIQRNLQLAHLHLLYLNASDPGVRAFTALLVISEIDFEHAIAVHHNGDPALPVNLEKSPTQLHMLNDMFPGLGTSLAKPYTSITPILQPAIHALLTDTNAALVQMKEQLGKRDLEPAQIQLIDQSQHFFGLHLHFPQFTPPGNRGVAFRRELDEYLENLEGLNRTDRPFARRLYLRMRIAIHPKDLESHRALLAESEIIRNLDHWYPHRDPKMRNPDLDPTHHYSQIDELPLEGEEITATEVIYALQHLVENKYYKAAIALLGLASENNVTIMDEKLIRNLRFFASNTYHEYATSKVNPDTQKEPCPEEIYRLGQFLSVNLKRFDVFVNRVLQEIDPKVASPLLIENLKAWQGIYARDP